MTQFAVFHYNIGQQRSPQHFSILSIVRHFFITVLFHRQLSTLFCITFLCHSFQFNINEYLCIVIASIFLTLLFDYPFGNLKKNIFDSPNEAPKVETDKTLLNNNNNELDLNGNAIKMRTKIE